MGWFLDLRSWHPQKRLHAVDANALWREMAYKMKLKKFKKYSGFVVKGKIPQQPVDMRSTHLQKAAWLTAEVESGGMYGSVMNYDGTGMTAGIHQAIAVYPRNLEDDKSENDQGPLWKLIAQIRAAVPHLSWLQQLERRFENIDWHIDQEGVVRGMSMGHRVLGENLRTLLSGPRGRVPIKGERRAEATVWIELFHKLFSSPETFTIQDAFGERHFTKRSKAKLRFCKNKFHRRFRIRDYFYQHEHISSVTLPRGLASLDIAACMFWSHTVNAPGRTLKLLCKDIDEHGFPVRDYIPGTEMGKRIIKLLGNDKYGRWDDDIKNGRYQRTRKAAMQVWPKEFFVGPEAIMPKDLEG